MYKNDNSINFARFLRYIPTAVAMIEGSDKYPEISGVVKFYQTAYGSVVFVEAVGLPQGGGACDKPIFGFHIHEGGACTGSTAEPFANALSHYDPHGCPHPYHAGDMPPLFGVGGGAFLAFLTDRFTVNEILGKTVIIHDRPDDFTTQPSGNAGNKIACGVISSVRR